MPSSLHGLDCIYTAKRGQLSGHACIAACLHSLRPYSIPSTLDALLYITAVWAVVSMDALYSPCTRRMGLHQIHIWMTGIMNSLALYSLHVQYIGLCPILFQCTTSITLTVLVNCTNSLSCNHSSHCSSTSVCVCEGGGGEAITCWVTHVHALQREGPSLCSYTAIQDKMAVISRVVDGV